MSAPSEKSTEDQRTTASLPATSASPMVTLSERFVLAPRALPSLTSRFQCLQSLESVKLVKKSDFKGRVVTSAGQRDMDRVAALVANAAAPAPVVEASE